MEKKITSLYSFKLLEWPTSILKQFSNSKRILCLLWGDMRLLFELPHSKSLLEKNRQSGKQDKFIQYMDSTQPILFWRKDMEFPCKRKRNGRENRDSKEREEGYSEDTVSWM